MLSTEENYNFKMSILACCWPGRDGVPDCGTAGGPVARAVRGDLGSCQTSSDAS